MKGKLKSVAIVIVAAVLGISICLGGCAAPTPEAPTPEAPTPEVKGPIKVACFTDLTGPVAAQVAYSGWQFEDYFNWLNEQGGIDGHPVEATVIDHRYDVSLLRTAYKKMKAEGIVCGSSGACSMVFNGIGEFAPEDEIPFIQDCFHGIALYPPSWFFSLLLATDDRVAGFGDWILENWKESRKPRLALLMGDYGAGKGPMEAKWYLEDKGIDVVAEEIVPLAVTDTIDHMTRIRDAKPDFIFDTALIFQQKLLLRDRVMLEMQDIPMMNFYWTYGMVISMIRPEEYDGYMNMASIAQSWQQEIPGVVFGDELHKGAGREGDHAPAYLPLAHHMLMADAIKRALDKVGYENLNGKAVYDALTTTKNFTADGLTFPASFTKERTRGTDEVRLIQLHKDGPPTIIDDSMECPWNLKLAAEAK